MKKFYIELSHPSSKTAVFRSSEDLPYIANDLNLTMPFKILQKTFRTAYVGFLTKRNYFLNNQLDRKVTQAVESGLMDFWRPEMKPKPANNTGPQVLTLEHLAVGFLICMVCLLIAFIFFVIEHVQQKILYYLMSYGYPFAQKFRV